MTRTSNKKLDRKLRLSQTVSPFGVGAIFDLLGESFVACDIAMWGAHGDTIRLSRLEHELGVDRLRSAPSQVELFGRKGAGVPYSRFPRWLFCQKCRTMYWWRRSDEREDAPALCSRNNCGSKAPLVPMRFVVVCPNGHLSDVPWREWAHSNATDPAQRQCQSLNLALTRSSSASAGLAALRVYCRSCKAARSLAGISARDSLLPLNADFGAAVACQGTQPWQRNDGGHSCDQQIQVVQRGASNIYFPEVRSALDIPPASDYDPYSELSIQITTQPEFEALVSAPDGPLAPILIAAIAEKLGCPESAVESAIQIAVSHSAGSIHNSPAADKGESDLYDDEWTAFTAPDVEPHPRDKFVKVSARFFAGDPPPGSEGLEGLVDQVALATRLREVRALAGFRRFSDDGPAVRPDLDRGLSWLPAVEVFGEGIFLSLREDAVRRWESQSRVREIEATMEQRRSRSLAATRLRPATARYMALHTFAHILIRQLSFECGYATASLRERVYARRTDDPSSSQAGVLIYTAAGDVEGTLGGLVAQGKPPRLAATVLRALEGAAWCSTDPLCRENSGQGFQALNRAACHACSLLPETSCEAGNKLLDRTLILGDGNSLVGLFEKALEVSFSRAKEAR